MSTATGRRTGGMVGGGSVTVTCGEARPVEQPASESRISMHMVAELYINARKMV